MEPTAPLIQFFAINGIIASFLAGLYNEEAVLLMAFLSGEGHVALWKVVVFGFIGIMIHDSLVFMLGSSRLAAWTKRKFKLSHRLEGLVHVIERMRERTEFVPLFISKFIYGARTAIILYISSSGAKITYLRFVLYNIAAMCCWFALMIPLAWFAGQGFEAFFHIAQGTEKILGAVAILIIGVYLLNKLVISIILRAQKSN